MCNFNQDDFSRPTHFVLGLWTGQETQDHRANVVVLDGFKDGRATRASRNVLATHDCGGGARCATSLTASRTGERGRGRMVDGEVGRGRLQDLAMQDRRLQGRSQG